MSVIDAISVAKFMTGNVKTINHADSLKQAAKLMYENDIGSLVVVWSYEPTKPAGIVTERDIMKVVSFDQLYQPTLPHEISLLDMTVMSFMSTPVITIPPSASLWDALQVMQQNKIRRLPVVQKETLIGIITEKDIVKAIANNRSIVCELQDRMPTSAESIFERLREVTFSESLFPTR
jgi:CBS domain-containing protein